MGFRVSGKRRKRGAHGDLAICAESLADSLGQELLGFRVYGFGV